MIYNVERRTLLLIFISTLIIDSSKSLSFNQLKTNLKSIKGTTTRQDFLQKFFLLNVSPILFVNTVILPTLSTNAVCLPGDISENCIGVYKVPIDDEILDYINTPEKLLKYAPDITNTFIEPIQYPKNSKIAYNELIQLQLRIKLLKDKVLINNDLIYVGKELLYIIPRINVIGKVILSKFEDLSTNNNNNNNKLSTIQIDNINNKYLELLVSLNECDILIGQCIRGELGSLTIGQVYIIRNLDEIESNYNYFISSIPIEFIK